MSFFGIWTSQPCQHVLRCILTMTTCFVIALHFLLGNCVLIFADEYQQSGRIWCFLIRTHKQSTSQYDAKLQRTWACPTSKWGSRKFVARQAASTRRWPTTVESGTKRCVPTYVGYKYHQCFFLQWMLNFSWVEMSMKVPLYGNSQIYVHASHPLHIVSKMAADNPVLKLLKSSSLIYLLLW